METLNTIIRTLALLGFGLLGLGIMAEILLLLKAKTDKTSMEAREIQYKNNIK